MQIAVLRAEIKASSMFVSAVDSKYVIDYLLSLECRYVFDLLVSTTFIPANSVCEIILSVVKRRTRVTL